MYKKSPKILKERRKLISELNRKQKWSKYDHFWNCGHNMLKNKTKIYMDHILVMINMCVGLENNLRGHILEIYKMVKIAKMAIKWPKFKNGSC